MAVLSLLKNIENTDDTIFMHPCNQFKTYTKYNYLKGMIVIARNEDDEINDNEIDYINTLASSFEIEDEALEKLFNEALNPTQEMMQDIVVSILTTTIKHHFILDCIIIADSDDDFDKNEKQLIKQFENVFNISKKESNEIHKIYKYLKNQKLKKLITLLTKSQYFSLHQFDYLVEYFQIESIEETHNLDMNIFDFNFIEPIIRHGDFKNASKILKNPISNLQYATFLNAMLDKELIKFDTKGNVITNNSNRILLSKQHKEIIFKDDIFEVVRNFNDSEVVYITFSGAFMFIEWINELLNTDYKLTELQSDRFHNLSLDDLNHCLVQNELFIKDGKYSKKNKKHLLGLSSCSSVDFNYYSKSSSFRFMY